MQRSDVDEISTYLSINPMDEVYDIKIISIIIRSGKIYKVTRQA